MDEGHCYNVKSRTNKQNNGSTNFLIPQVGWTMFPSQDIPVNFNYGHVYHYITESVNHLFLPNSGTLDQDENLDDNIDDEDTVTAKPLRKGYWLVRSGFLENIEDCLTNENYFLRGHVHHSMKAEKPLKVILVLSSIPGFVKFTQCDCRAAALGRCAHVTAVLLMLSDYVAENGYIVQDACTSNPCQWNKGKKRTKNPQKLHQAEYSSSSKRQRSDELYKWDPRPEECRDNIDVSTASRFVVQLQAASLSTDRLSMSETLSKVSYEDFELSAVDVAYYKKLTETFQKCFSENDIKILGNAVEHDQIPNTDHQGGSTLWHESQQYRVTASICKSAVLLGEKLSPEASKIPLFN